MSTTGWTGEGPGAEAPPLPMTGLLLSMGRGEPQPGAVLEQAQARARAAEAAEARAAAAAAPDPDERASNLVARGVGPGMISDLARRLGDTLAELEGEREKIDKAERRQERISRDHQAGRITVADIARMDDFDEGDPAVVARLERRAGSLRRQLAEASELMAPQQLRVADPLEAATQRARSAGHQAFVEATRAKMAAARDGRQAPPPFASASRGGAAVRAETVTCQDCIDAGADAEQSYLIHADPSAPPGVRLPVAELTEADLAEFGRR